MKDHQAHDIIDSPDNNAKESIRKNMILWWEKRRLYYNLLLIAVLSFVIYGLWFKVSVFGLDNTIWMAVYYLFGANLFYTSGWLLGVLMNKINGYEGLTNKSRWLVWILGTFLSMIWMFIIMSVFLDGFVN